jgi:ribonuclease-3
VGGGSLARSEPAELEQRLGYRFAQPRLLEQALTHQSRAHEEGDLELGNERLEFLGDAVLDLLVSELLMQRYPDADEGELSRARAAAVNTAALAERARSLGLGAAARLGRGEQRSGGEDKVSILANLFEAVLGAVYLDGDLTAARGFIEREVAPLLSRDDAALGDAKTRLQEIAQKLGRGIPRYATLAERGPDHEKEFEVEVRVGDAVLGRGVGPSKRSAEQSAAHRALESLEADSG